MRINVSHAARWLAALLLGVSVASGLAPAASLPTQAASPDIVISQVYGGGGNAGATYTHDFVELFNRGATAVTVNGWSIQYTSATGTGLFASSPTAITELPNVTLQPGQYYLIQESSNAAVGTPLPTPDLVDTTPIPMGAGAGKLALVNTITPLNCNGSTTPCSPAALATIVDLVGYGNANFFEGAAPAPTPSATLSVIRGLGGCMDTDQNGADFVAASVAPRSMTTTFAVCGAPPTATLTVTPGTPAPTSTHTPSPTAAATPPVARIRDIQGAQHRSPFVGQAVTGVSGIVTAKRFDNPSAANNNIGFYIQDPSPDADERTSEGIFVFTATVIPGIQIGDLVSVSGSVREFRAGTNNLSVTQIQATAPGIQVISSGNPVPTPVTLGAGGRAIPNLVVSNDNPTSDVEQVLSANFDPAEDALDLYESLEGMLVQVNDARVVGPTASFGEIPVLSDNGGGASGLIPGRGILYSGYADGNPERIFLDDQLIQPTPVPTVSGQPTATPLPLVMPNANVADRLAPVIGVVDFSFSNYKVQVLAAPSVTPGPLQKESTALQGDTNRLTVASFNVENLDPGDTASFPLLASAIVNNLKSPDILALEEVQDNNGPINDSVVDASVTLNTLIMAIANAGGPTYAFRQINPVDDQDGGEPGGNIRVAFLFNPARVTFVDRPGGDSVTPVTVLQPTPGVPQLSFSPGRVDPLNTAWNSSRKPLTGEFVFNGRTLFVIANHFNSKGGDQPLMGRFQPPSRSSETQRSNQATALNTFVANILAIDPTANVIVAGDINDFVFSPVLAILRTGDANGAGTVELNNLFDLLSPNERFSYVFEGNSQVLDHILVSPSILTSASPEYDVVHMNAEFADQLSDHDPSVARFGFSPPATPTATPSITPTSTPTSTPTNTPTLTPSSTPTNTTTPTLTPTATPSVPQLSSYVAFGAQKSHLFARSQVMSGNVGANTALPCQPGQDTCAEVILGVGAQMPAGSSLVGDTLVLRSQSQAGNVIFNEKLGPGTVHGSSASPLALPVLTIPGVTPCTPSTTDINVASFQTRTLTPGAYGTLRARAGATLILQGGSYCIESIELDAGAKLLFSGASQVTVLDKLDAAARVTIGPAPSASSPRARDIVVRVAGVENLADDEDDESEDEEDRGRRGPARTVDIGPRSTVKANILAPSGDIRLGARTDATGTFIGQRVRVGVLTRLTLDSAF